MEGLRDAGGLSILLVEDDAGDGPFVERVLRDAMAQLQIQSVGDAHAALERLEREDFDVVVLDLSSRDASGLAVANTVVKAAIDTPVVVLTSLDDELGRRCLEGGAEDYVQKNVQDRTHMVRCTSHALVRARTKSLTSRADHAQRVAAIGQLAAGVAHEVNNPTAFMLLNLEMIARHVDALRGTYSGAVDAAQASSVLGDIEQLVDDTIQGIDRIVAVARHLRSLAREGLRPMC